MRLRDLQDLAAKARDGSTLGKPLCLVFRADTNGYKALRTTWDMDGSGVLFILPDQKIELMERLSFGRWQLGDERELNVWVLKPEALAEQRYHDWLESVQYAKRASPKQSKKKEEAA